MSFTRWIVALATLLATSTGSMVPASADTVILGPFQGSGTVYPGLDELPHGATWDFSGWTLQIADVPGAAVACRVDASGLESLTSGVGTFGVRCGTLFETGGVYIHVGAVLTMVGPDFNATIAYTPYNMDPMTAYSFAGVAEYMQIRV